MGMYTFHAFAGAGGGILADILLGHTPVGAVEIEDYPRKVLLQRQLDGILPIFPIWDDVTTFRRDNKDTSEFIERLRSIRHNLCICGGFPCQDISSAGKGAGIKDGTRSGLWFELSRIIGDIQPARVFLENSPMLVSRGLDVVLSGFTEVGYDTRWGIVSAADTGAPHLRKRIWIIAGNTNTSGKGLEGENKTRRKSDIVREDAEIRNATTGLCGEVSNPKDQRIMRRVRCSRESNEQPEPIDAGKEIHAGRQWWKAEPGLGRVAHGVADRVDRLKAIGNGQVPSVVELAWEILG